MSFFCINSRRGSPSDRRLALAFSYCGSTGGGAVGEQTTYGQDNMTKDNDAASDRYTTTLNLPAGSGLDAARASGRGAGM